MSSSSCRCLTWRRRCCCVVGVPAGDGDWRGKHPHHSTLRTRPRRQRGCRWRFRCWTHCVLLTHAVHRRLQIGFPVVAVSPAASGSFALLYPPLRPSLFVVPSARGRPPLVSDDLCFWNDLLSWRQVVHEKIIKNSAYTHKFTQDRVSSSTGHLHSRAWRQVINSLTQSICCSVLDQFACHVPSRARLLSHPNGQGIPQERARQPRASTTRLVRFLIHLARVCPAAPRETFRYGLVCYGLSRHSTKRSMHQRNMASPPPPQSAQFVHPHLPICLIQPASRRVFIRNVPQFQDFFYQQL